MLNMYLYGDLYGEKITVFFTNHQIIFQRMIDFNQNKAGNGRENDVIER